MKALNLDVFHCVIISYISNSLDLIFNMYMYMFLFIRKRISFKRRFVVHFFIDNNKNLRIYQSCGNRNMQCKCIVIIIYFFKVMGLNVWCVMQLFFNFYFKNLINSLKQMLHVSCFCLQTNSKVNCNKNCVQKLSYFFSQIVICKKFHY